MWDEFKAYLGQLSRVRKWEAGENPDDTSKMTPEQFAQAVLSGDITPDLAKLTGKKGVQKHAEKQKIGELLGIVPAKLKVRAYGGNK